MTLSAKPLTPVFAAEITGIDQRVTPDAATAREIGAAIDQYGVLVFRNAEPLTNELHADFARSLGPLMNMHKSTPVKVEDGLKRIARVTHPEVTDNSNLDDEGKLLPPDSRRALFKRGDRLWHTDNSFKTTRATYSLLHGFIVPNVGSDTEFADMRAAYDALPQTMKDRVDNLTAIHWVWHSRMAAGFPEPTEMEKASSPPVEHKLVHAHPRSGRKSLYIAAHAWKIKGMEEKEGQALIQELIEFATQRQFVYAHKWRKGDTVMWDNLATMHRATFDDPTQPRDVRRATVLERDEAGNLAGLFAPGMV